MSITIFLKMPQKTLYDYQHRDIETIFEKIQEQPASLRLLYQLPTGGGKTVVFSAIVAKYVSTYQKKVIVLTHRTELSKQTSSTLKEVGISNRLINSSVKVIRRKDGYACYVAMVKTLKNRIKDKLIDPQEIGLVIVDEAHHNSFTKLLAKFTNAAVLGVTATPFSSDVTLPMRRNYRELILGQDITSLIQRGFLAKPTTWRYEVELNTLKTGLHGDFSISTSDELYSSPAMQELLVDAYTAHAKGKKTLIFNNGIFTSKKVLETFTDLGYPIRHLDNSTPPAEREEILRWLKKTKGAILTSVSILTTGFDEPTVQTVILNRATTSLTLYHQMIGRGARRLPNKKTFGIIDLGNNTDRFGHWDHPLDWQDVFEHPEAYHYASQAHTDYESHLLPSNMRNLFPNSLEISMDIQAAYQQATAEGLKAKTVIRDSIRQHALMCADNSMSVQEALNLLPELEKEIVWRIKQYSKCLGRVTKNYTEWLLTDYRSRLEALTVKIVQKRATLKATA